MQFYTGFQLVRLVHIIERYCRGVVTLLGASVRNEPSMFSNTGRQLGPNPTMTALSVMKKRSLLGQNLGGKPITANSASQTCSRLSP